MDGPRSFGADELTLRAEEVGSLRTFIDTKHVAASLMRTATPPVKPFTKELKETNGKSFVLSFRELSQAAGAKMSSESQKAKALWAMKAVRDRSEEFL